MRNLFIVIPNWNGADLIGECLDSLQEQSQATQIVVVDNGSVDDSIDIIEKSYPEVVLIKLPENTGFSGGVNTGIKYALEQGADAVALFNNDAVADKDWLKNLSQTMDENPKSGIVTGKLLLTDKKHLDTTGDFYSVWGMPFPRGRNQRDEGQYDEPGLVFGASGGASLYQAAMFNHIGLFDERFFAYYEDVDISFRAQLYGWDVYYQPSARAYHHLSATSSKLGNFSRYHATKNFFMLYTKNMPGWLFWKYLPLFSLQAARLAASSILKGHSWTYLKGLGRAILNIPYVRAERRRIQKERLVHTEAIDVILYKQRPPRILKIS